MSDCYLSPITTKYPLIGLLGLLILLQFCLPGTVHATDLTGKVKIVDANSPCIVNCDGNSLAKAWRRLSDIRGLQTGMDICLMSNSVFEDQRFNPGRSFHGKGADGVHLDSAIVGTCYVDAGSGNALRWYNEGSGAGRGKRAEINGTYDAACRNDANLANNTDTCQFNNPRAVPQRNQQGLVQIVGSYVTVQDLSVRDSAALAFRVAIKNAQGVRVLRSQAIDIFAGFWKADRGAQYWVLDENLFMHGQYRQSPGYRPQGAGNANCITFSRESHIDEGKPSYGLYTNNTMVDCKGEGVTFLQVSHAIAHGNRIYNTSNTGYYVDNGAYNVMQWSITGRLKDACRVFRKDPAKCNRQNPMGETTFRIEAYPAKCAKGECTDSDDSTNNVFRHQLIAYSESILLAGMDYNIRRSGLSVGKDFHHVTVVGVGAFRNKGGKPIDVQKGTTIANWVFDGVGSIACFAEAGRMSHNAFTMPEDQLMPLCQGPGDEYGAAPVYANAPKTYPDMATGYRLADFEIVRGAGNSSAVDLTSTPIDWLDETCSQLPQLKWANFTSPLGVVGFPQPCAQFRMKGYFNFKGESRKAENDKGF